MAAQTVDFCALSAKASISAIQAIQQQAPQVLLPAYIANMLLSVPGVESAYIKCQPDGQLSVWTIVDQLRQDRCWTLSTTKSAKSCAICHSILTFTWYRAKAVNWAHSSASLVKGFVKLYKPTVPSKDEHLNRATDNETLARSLDLDKPVCVDWAITILFYSALHYIDAYLAGKLQHPPDHTARDSQVSSNASLADIYRDYRFLKDKSEEARYNIANFHKSQLPKIEDRFKKIRAHVLSKIR